MNLQEDMSSELQHKGIDPAKRLAAHSAAKIGKWIIALIRLNKKNKEGNENTLTDEEKENNGLVSLSKLQGLDGENAVTVMDPICKQLYDFLRQELREQNLQLRHSIEVVRNKDTGEQMISIAYQPKDREIMGHFLDKAMAKYNALEKDSITQNLKKKQKEIARNKEKQKEKKKSQTEHDGR